MKTTNRPVIITTQYRGVYYGELVEHDSAERTCVLENARMVIRWGTTDGVDQLAATGPTASSKLGALAPKVWLCGITSVSDCTPEAQKAWRGLP
jgi:hypothetical protein